MSYIRPTISDPNEIYPTLQIMAESMLEDETDWVSALANLSALLFDQLPDLNWAGFYRVKNSALILGPFQGKPACNYIAKGKGVCGTAWLTDAIQLVPDVHQFPGHIACDSASNSEIVIPIHNQNNEFCALLDIDSPVVNRFTQADQDGLVPIVTALEKWLSKHNIDQL